MYFILYNDNQNQWRWKFRAANHETVCVSSEAYTTKQGAQHSINLVKVGASPAKTFDETTQTWV